MSNLQTYNKLFRETFALRDAELPEAKYLRTKLWDSLHHMELMSALEEAFGISLNTLDVMDFSSYETGKTVLAKYGVEL
ncbi:MAG: acyl carrier protein [Oscillospiraceae bacterium]|nr:acyl carrier protein [Oscillospiraceae bacterium]